MLLRLGPHCPLLLRPLTPSPPESLRSSCFRRLLSNRLPRPNAPATANTVGLFGLRPVIFRLFHWRPPGNAPAEHRFSSVFFARTEILSASDRHAKHGPIHSGATA